jgi:hypothetical protein
MTSFLMSIQPNFHHIFKMLPTMDLVLSKLHYNSSITVGDDLTLHVATFIYGDNCFIPSGNDNLSKMVRSTCNSKS